MNMDERTLRPGELKDAATLRPGHFIAGAAAAAQESLNQSVGNWELVRVLETREHCMNTDRFAPFLLFLPYAI